MEKVLENAKHMAEGANSQIYCSDHSELGERVIIKVLKKSDHSHQQLTHLFNEYEHLQNINIEGVRRTFGKIKIGNKQAIILEYFNGKSIKEIINKERIDIIDFLKLSIKISNTLDLIHQENIIHKDFNSNNLLVNVENHTIKVIDFGLASKLNLKTEYHGNPELLEGTLSYISPEQTGRINSLIDYRTDLYSLGVTLYEWLTGELPFESSDPMGLIHAHLAITPTPPHEVDSTIPEVLSEIILKLLSKNRENRYQSARGLNIDLQKCLQQYLDHHKIPPFELAKHDFSGKFQIPQKLYGRKKEISLLLTCFEKVCLGATELLLISGNSGTGKTSLVNECQKLTAKERGNFISGKYEQLQQNRPYFALIQAFRSAVEIILTENEQRLDYWRAKIRNVIGNDGKLLTDVIPNLELIIGEQPDLPELGGEESQNRFNYVFKNFVQSLSSKKHPLVLFIDDLQWADFASIRLLEELILDRDVQYFFLIGAYRSNEVDASHPLQLTKERIKRGNKHHESITLEDLSLKNVFDLISDTLNHNQSGVNELAEVVYSKTKGNAFFTNQFLKTLYERKLLKIDYNTFSKEENQGTWTWDIDEIKKLNITDNVIVLMSDKVKHLSDDTQQALKMASCIGNRFDLNTLSIILEKSPQQTAEDLWKALEEGLVLPMSNNYKTIDLDGIEALPIEYRFVHDRVQQATYSLIPEENKKNVHATIGQLLYDNVDLKEDDEQIFDVVNQLNKGADLISGKEEKARLARLNLIAGKKAQASTAYQPAYRYLKKGIGLSTDDCWESKYDFALSLYTSAAEVAFLSGEFEEMKSFVREVATKAKNVLDKVKVYKINIQSCIAQDQSAEAVNIAKSVMRELNVKLPDEPNKKHIITGLIKTSLILKKKSMEDLENLPEMTDPYALAFLEIAASVGSAMSRTTPELLPLMIFKQIQLSIKHGNSIQSIPVYGGYGIIQCGIIGNIDAGYKFGALAMRLLEKFNAKSIESKTYIVNYSFIDFWKNHLNRSFDPLLKSYYIGLETGDHEFAAASLMVRGIHHFLCGKELFLVSDLLLSYSKKINGLNQKLLFQQVELFRQITLNLTGNNSDPCKISGEAFDEDEVFTEEFKANNKAALFYFWYNKMVLCYLFGCTEEALQFSKKLDNNLDTLIGTIFIPIIVLYDSLVRASLYPSRSASEQRAFIKRIKKNQKKMKKWAKHAPENFQHKYDLVQAELYRITGEKYKAKSYYDKAIVNAQKNEYLNEEALAYELAARHYLKHKQEFPYEIYLRKSYETYRQWGVTAKSNQLAGEFPLLLSVSLNMNDNSMDNTSLKAISLDNYSTLELSTILKASTTISSEIKLEKVLEKLLKIVIENAGAERGYLLLNKDNELYVNAKGTAEQDKIEILQSVAVSNCSFLPETIINYVSRTKENVILSDAFNNERFNKDPFIVKTKPKSILCIPIINQGELTGAIYLENNLTVGAFTNNRIEILKLLSGQIAVSIENSRLYDNLEQKVVERTKQIESQTMVLKETNKELIDLNDEKDHLISVVAHDLRNPLNQIKGMVNIIKLTNEEANEEQTQYVDMIMQSSDRMAEMISRILDVNAIEAKKINLKLETIGLKQLVSELSNNFKLAAKEKNIEIIMELCHEDSMVYVDKNYTIQVLENLISNAIKFSEADKKIYLRVCEIEETVRFEVKDQGPGISSEDMKKLFEKYQQLTARPTAGEKSTGLGLSIVKKYVEAMKGKIWCESELEKGSSFFVEFKRYNQA